MKSFFQRFHDSQPAGAPKSRTKDSVYKQWIPSKSDKDRVQLSDGVEPNITSSSKRPAPKSAGLRPPDVPTPAALGRIPTDYTTRYSTIPGASIGRHLPPSLPLSKTHPPGPPISKATSLKPPDETKDKPKLLVKRNEIAEVSGNETDATVRIKSGRPSRPAQPLEPAAPQQHQIWHPPGTKVPAGEKEKKKSRQKYGEEAAGEDNRPLREYDTDRKNGRPDGNQTDRGEGDDRQKLESQEREWGVKDRQAIGGRKTEQWEQQEREAREKELRDLERLKERKEKAKEKAREKEKERDHGVKREREVGREAERDRDRVEEKDKKKAEGRNKDGEKKKAPRERPDRELQTKEQQERERQERKTKQRHIEKERWEREQLERLRRDIEKEKERVQREQKERERAQQEKWEREQEEIERKELERLGRERLKERADTRREERESRRRLLDSTAVNLVQAERERQEQRRRERELWEQQRVREHEERERQWRNEKAFENAGPISVDPRTGGLNIPRPKNKSRKEGASDSEKEHGRTREPDRRRTSRMLAQLDTPPKSDHRGIELDALRLPEHPMNTQTSKQFTRTSGVDDPNANRPFPKSTPQDDGYNSEFSRHNRSTQNSPDPPGRSVPPNISPTQQVRPTLFSVNAPQFSNPPMHATSTQNPRVDSIPPAKYSPHTTQNPPRTMLPDTSNQIRLSPKETVESTNRPVVLFEQSQPPARQITAPDQGSSLVHAALRPPPFPTEVTGFPSLGPSSTSALPAPPVRGHASQETNHLLPVSIPHISQSSALPPSGVPPKMPDSSTRETRFPSTPVISGVQDPRTIVPIAISKSSRSYSQVPVAPSAPETRSFAGDHRPDPTPLGSSSVPHHFSTTAPPQTALPSGQGVSSGQQNHKANANTKESPLQFSPNLTTNSGRPSIINATNDTKERPYNIRKNERQMPPTQPPIPPVPVTTTSRPAVINKRSNTVPQIESHQDLISPLADPKVTSVARLSPTYHVVRIQDTIPPTDITNILQPNKVDRRSRVSPQGDKILLQEFTPPTLHQHHADNLGNHNQLDHRPQPTLPSALTLEDRIITSEYKQGNYSLAHALPPPSIDNQDVTHPRHQRYYSESETVKHRGKPMKFQPVEEDTQVSKPTQVLPAGSKPKATQTSNIEPDANPKIPNIAFRTPATGGTVNERKYSEENRLGPAGVLESSRAQPTQGPDTTRVPYLTSHYEHMEQTARLGGAILRPGTTVPRDAARATTREPPPQVVPSNGHSLFAPAPQIERPRTSHDVRPPIPNSQPTLSKVDRISTFDAFPSAQPPPTTTATAVESRYPPYQIPSDGHPTLKNTRINTVGQSIPRPSTAVGNRDAGYRPHPPGVLALTHKASYSEGMAIKELKGEYKALAALNDNTSRPNPLYETIKGTEREQPQRSAMPSVYEGQAQIRQHLLTKGEPEAVQLQPALTVPSEAREDLMVRKNDTGNSIRERPVIHPSPTSTWQRKESSPRTRLEENPTKAPVADESPTQDPLTTHRPNYVHGHSRVAPPTIDGRHHSHGPQLTEAEAHRLATVPSQKDVPETNVTVPRQPSPMQRPSSDERNRPKGSQGNHSPHVPQPSPASMNGVSISPQRTGNSGHLKLEEENRPQKQRSIAQVRDPRLADLLSPPKTNDAVYQSSIRDARRILMTKPEREPNTSPDTPSNNFAGSSETIRLRGSSGRGEHSPRNLRVDSSPSGAPSISPPNTQPTNLSTKDHTYARHSPNISQHTPSPRSRSFQAEDHAEHQPEVQQRNDPPHSSDRSTSRQPPSHEKTQDRVLKPDPIYSRKHEQAALSTTRDVNARMDDANRTSYIPSNSIPYTSEQRTGGTALQRVLPPGDTHDVPQSISIAGRPRAESRNAQDTPIPPSRHPNTTSREPYNITPSQMQAFPNTPASNHVPPTSTGPPVDHPQNSRSSSSTQQALVRRDEVPIPPQPVQAHPMKSTLSNGNYAAPLPPEPRTSNSSAPQPSTPKAYEFWLPPSSSVNDHAPPRTTATPTSRREREREHRRDRDHPRRMSTAHQGLRDVPYQPSAPGATKAYHYLKTRKIHRMSLVSTEAQDGAASTVIGSPTTSILSQAPIYIPPEQDPITATREWTEAGAILPGQKIRRPGLVWADLEDIPPLQLPQAEHRRPEPRSSRPRRPRSSSSRSKEASDTDQPSS